jgi:Flp pilus assembly protein TadG
MKFYFSYQRTQRGNRSRRASGSVLVEAAVAVVFLLLPLTLGIMQFGVFYNASNAVSQIAREGGRIAAVYGNAADNPATPANEGSDAFLQDRIKDVFDSTSLNPLKNSSDFEVTIEPADRAARTQFSQVKVTVKYNLNEKAFLFFRPGFVTRTSYSMLEKKENTVITVITP